MVNSAMMSGDMENSGQGAAQQWRRLSKPAGNRFKAGLIVRPSILASFD